MYDRIIRPLLFALPIERAHRLVLLALRVVGWIPGGRWLLDRCCAVHHPSLGREVFGRSFPNPVGLAAGFDRNGDAVRELAALGFGFVEVGTVTPRQQAGNPRPRVFRLERDRALVDRMGFPNRGLERTIQRLRRPRHGLIVGCNIGRNASTPPEEAPHDYLKLFRNLYQYADYFSVKLGCDNASNDRAVYTRRYMLGILQPLFDFRRGQNQYRPILLKVSPDMTDEEIDRVADILIETPLDGVVATDGTRARTNLNTSPEAIDDIGAGRLGGAPLTQRAIEIVRRIHTRSGGAYPIIGVGGVMTPDDARAMLKAGADLVQLYTGFVCEGPRLVRDICRALIDEAEELTAMRAAEASMQEPEEAGTDSSAAGHSDAAGKADASPAPAAPAEASSDTTDPAAAPRDAADNR